LITWPLHEMRASPKQRPGLAGGRPCRVTALIFTIVLLSLADLYLTLVYLHSGGMGEANPLARWIMGHGSPTLLILWKLATITVASAILYHTRRTRTAEFGAVACVMVLTWLTLRWGHYSDEIKNITGSLHVLVDHEHSRWVSMPTTP
jgi:hypothetical protein